MITFAIPAYNVEDYIDPCLDSILSQADHNCEVMVVDDGSTDRTGAICDARAARDSRVRVIHQENRGVSAARNRCIDEAAGDWLCFVDGDDLLAGDAYRHMLAHLSEEFDVVYFDRQIFEDRCPVPAYSKRFQTGTLRGESLRALRLDTLYEKNGKRSASEFALRSVCAKAFRMEFLRDFGLKLHSELVYAEDVSFNLDCLKVCRCLKLVRLPVYLYRMRRNSAVHRYNPLAAEQYSAAADRQRMYLDGDPDLRERYYMDRISEIRSVLLLDMFHRDNPKTKAERKADLERFLALPWCREALEKVDRSGLKPVDREFLDVLAGGFPRLQRYFFKRRVRDGLKLAANRTGLAGLLRALRERRAERGGAHDTALFYGRTEI